MTDIRIYDRTLTLRHVYDGALRVTATEDFYDAGTFYLTVPLSHADSFSAEGILTIPGIGAGYVIERIEKNASSGHATVSGRGVLSLFGRRILPEQGTACGAAEPYLLEYARAAAEGVLDAPLSTVEYGFPGEVWESLGGTSYLTVMKTVCRRANLGMRLAVTEGGFLFSARPETAGELRLSRDDGQIIGGTSLTDVKRYANQIIVVGGDGRSITVRADGLFDDGIDDGAQPVREILLTVPEILPGDYETEELYLQALFGKGKASLSRRRPKRTVTVDVASDTAAQMAVGTRFPLADGLLGVTASALCQTRKIVLDEAGIRHSAELTLGV